MECSLCGVSSTRLGNLIVLLGCVLVHFVCMMFLCVHEFLV